VRVRHSHEEAVNPRGFSLIELLIACGLLVLVGGAVAALAGPLRLMLERSDSSAQLEPAGRAALEAVVADIRESGSDASVADPRFRLAGVSARLLPLRDLDSNDVAIPGGAIRVVRMPRPAAQAVLGAAAAAGDTVLVLETMSRCAGGPPVCGFAPGSNAMVYDAAAAEVVTVASVGVGRVIVSRPLAASFATGAVLSELSATTYGTRRTVDGSRQLVRRSTGGAELPILDNVADFEVTTDTADLSRVSQVGLRVRIEAASASLRGPAGYLFRRAGTTNDARRWLPDVELRFTIALRNPRGDV
jgi:Prokaryotic N-terminal methylation motif